MSRCKGMDSVVASVLTAQNTALSTQISTKVLRKAMDAERAAGEQIVDMIRQAAPPEGSRGPGLDLYA